MPTKIWLRNRLSSYPLGKPVSDADYDAVITGEADVYKPNGDRLCCVRRGVVTPEHRELARPAGKLAGTLAATDNRGLAGGGHRRHPVKADGTISRTTRTYDDEGNRMLINSAIIGFFDRYPRIPYCRQTVFNANHAEEFDALRPLMADVAQCFANTVPERYAVQMGWAQRTAKDFVITGTPWTTVTVNYNWATHTHTDKGDLDDGFSCLTVLRSGLYTGGVLVFPQFRVGIDLADGDLVMMDAHEIHANTPLVGDGERLSFVLYYRTKMSECGTAAEELERAKNRASEGLFPTEGT